MSDPRENDPVQVCEDVFQPLRGLGGRIGQLRPDLSRLHLGEDRKALYVFHVRGNPLNRVVSMSAKLFSRKMEAGRRRRLG